MAGRQGTNLAIISTLPCLISLLQAIADVVEAIIGAAYITGGRDTALSVTKCLNVPIPNIGQWSDFGRKTLPSPDNTATEIQPSRLRAVEDIIGHNFHRPHLLAQALVRVAIIYYDFFLPAPQTHASKKGIESTSYERLEFIGDAILDFSKPIRSPSLLKFLLFNKYGASISGYTTHLSPSPAIISWWIDFIEGL